MDFLGFLRWGVAFLLAVVSFAILPEYGYPVVLQADDVDNFWFGVIAAPLVGAAAVLIVGRPSGLALCVLSPPIGVGMNEAYSTGFGVFESLIVAFFYSLFHGFLALFGGAVVAGCMVRYGGGNGT